MSIEKSLARLDDLCSAGYAAALHISYTTPKFLFQTYAKDWMKIYSDKGLVLKDPTVLWGFENTGIALWSDLQELDTEHVMSLAAKHGLKHGFTYAINDEAGKTISSFARSEGEFSDAEIKEISAILDELHRTTADVSELTAATVSQLRDMSVNFTHG